MCIATSDCTTQYSSIPSWNLPASQLWIALGFRAVVLCKCVAVLIQDAQAARTDFLVTVATAVPLNAPTATTAASKIIHHERSADPQEPSPGAVTACSCARMGQELSGSIFLCLWGTGAGCYCAMNWICRGSCNDQRRRTRVVRAKAWNAISACSDYMC